MFSIVPVLVLIVLGATIALARTGRDTDGVGNAVPEPALPPPPAGIDWGVLRGLARVETWRLTTHPMVIVGAVMSAVAVTFFTEGTARVIHREAVVAGICAFPLAGLTLIAANLAALRSRRAAAQGMVDTTPASPATRVAAHLVSGLGPAALLAVLLTAWNVYLLAGDAAGHAPAISAVALGPVLVACAAAVGVLLAVWVPSAIVATAAVVALGFAEAFLASPAPEFRPVRKLAFWVHQSDDIPIELLDRKEGAHLAYVATLGLLVAAGALARHLPRRTMTRLTVTAVVLVLVSGVVVTRPLDAGGARHRAAWVNEAEQHQRCRDVPRARLCAYESYDFTKHWAPIVERVAGAVPVDSMPSVRVVQRVAPNTFRGVPPIVVRHLKPGVPREGEPWPPDGAVHPELRWSPGGETDVILALDVASVIVGLPVDRSTEGEACSSADQARAVVALWLAGHGSTDARQRLPGPEPSLDGESGPEAAAAALFPAVTIESWVAMYDPAVRWSVRDAAYAHELLGRPDDDVAQALAPRWAEVLDPDTTSDQLADWLGLPRRPSLDAMARTLATTEEEAVRVASRPQREQYAFLPVMAGRCR